MAGRPEEYRPSIGIDVLELMSQGFSIVGAAGKLGIGRSTVYYWYDKHPEFAALVDKAKAARQAHWEEELLSTTNSARVTAGLKALGGMRSPDWSDDSRLEVSGPGGTPLLIQAITRTIVDSRDEPHVIEHEADE